jgi:alkylmercury lyase
MTRTTADLADLARRIEDRFWRLSPVERRGALVIHRLLAKGIPVSDSDVGHELGMTSDEIGDLTRDWPGVYRDDEGHIVGFWGLSIPEMPHRFRLGDRQLHTWCAWDSLFLPEILRETADVTSTCPVTGEEIRLRVSPRGVEEVSPDGAVVSLLDPDTGDIEANRIISSFCSYIHFFASREVGEQWAANRGEGTFVLTLPEAVELGHLCNALRFGDELGTD